LRVSGSAASAFREVILEGFTAAKIFANPGARFFAQAMCFGSAAMSAASRALGERVSSLSKNAFFTANACGADRTSRL
jgi:hypothetical protein